jgi:hypothetical protein
MAKQRYNVDAAASTNGALLQAGPTSVHNIFINNASASAKWVRFYNKATAPTVGTDIPVFVVNVAASSSKEIPMHIDLEFTLGLGIAITGAAPYNDATAVAAHDVQAYIVYDNLK